jgi:hypothetical protein
MAEILYGQVRIRPDIINKSETTGNPRLGELADIAVLDVSGICQSSSFTAVNASTIVTIR